MCCMHMREVCFNNYNKGSNSIKDKTIPESTVTSENLRLKERAVIVLVIFNQLYHTWHFTLRSLIHYDRHWHPGRVTRHVCLVLNQNDCWPNNHEDE